MLKEKRIKDIPTKDNPLFDEMKKLPYACYR